MRAKGDLLNKAHLFSSPLLFSFPEYLILQTCTECEDRESRGRGLYGEESKDLEWEINL